MKTVNETNESAPWEFYVRPVHWMHHDLGVIAERYSSDGRRQHIVKGEVSPGLVLSNADIFGENGAGADAADAGSPCFDRYVRHEGETCLLSRTVIVSRVNDEVVKINFKNQMMGRDATSLWHRCVAKKAGECTATGASIEPGALIYRPIGNVSYRSARVLASTIETIFDPALPSQACLPSQNGAAVYVR